jgi:hypothetical protein
MYLGVCARKYHNPHKGNYEKLYKAIGETNKKTAITRERVKSKPNLLFSKHREVTL